MARAVTGSAMRVLEVGLGALAVGAALPVVLWLLGTNGLSLVDSSDLPFELGQRGDWNAVPYEPVDVSGATGLATTAAGNEILGGMYAVEVRPGDGTSEFFGNDSYLSLLSLTTAQTVAWSGVRILPMIGLMLMWWLLFRLVGQVRRGSGFQRLTAQRISLIGLMIAVGAPLTALLRGIVASWLVEDSTAASIATPRTVSIDFAPIVVGLVILVVGYAWREAVTMREELDGLV